jgi:hypothetical protein
MESSKSDKQAERADENDTHLGASSDIRESESSEDVQQQSVSPNTARQAKKTLASVEKALRESRLRDSSATLTAPIETQNESQDSHSIHPITSPSRSLLQDGAGGDQSENGAETRGESLDESQGESEVSDAILRRLARERTKAPEPSEQQKKEVEDRVSEFVKSMRVDRATGQVTFDTPEEVRDALKNMKYYRCYCEECDEQVPETQQLPCCGRYSCQNCAPLLLFYDDQEAIKREDWDAVFENTRAQLYSEDPTRKPQTRRVCCECIDISSAADVKKEFKSAGAQNIIRRRIKKWHRENPGKTMPTLPYNDKNFIQAREHLTRTYHGETRQILEGVVVDDDNDSPILITRPTPSPKPDAEVLKVEEGKEKE